MDNKSLAKEIVNVLKGILVKQDKDFVALHEPVFDGNEWKYAKNCIDSTFVSSVGKYVDHFEDMLTQYTGTKYAIAVVNGTAALHISLKLVGVQSGDEVLLPSLTFVATANAVTYCNAKPHFVDSEEKTLGLDAYKLDVYLQDIAIIKPQGTFNRKTGNRISAVIPMHAFGHPVDLDPLLEVCKKYGLKIVEDAAESLGSLYKNKHTGGFGKVSVLSFNGNKVVTTGGGGAILTNDEEIAKKAKHITKTAKIPHNWEYIHDEIGYNYRLPNINAALGCAQMERLPEFLEKKRILTNLYNEKFSNIKGVQLFTEADFAKSNYWLNVLLLDDADKVLKDQIIEHTNNVGIMTRPAWTLIHKLKMFTGCPRMDLSVAEGLEKRIINIPSSANLLED